jgi:SnoaL-like protein
VISAEFEEKSYEVPLYNQLARGQKRLFVSRRQIGAKERRKSDIFQSGLHAKRREAMSYSISTLLTRNLQEVFGENDPARRRAAVQQLYTEDGVFYDPSKGVYRGRNEIDRIAGEIRSTHLDFRYQPIAEPEETGNGGRVRWVAGRPGEAPAYAGTDFIVARDGRIAALYLFFDKLP